MKTEQSHWDWFSSETFSPPAGSRKTVRVALTTISLCVTVHLWAPCPVSPGCEDLSGGREWSDSFQYMRAWMRPCSWAWSSVSIYSRRTGCRFRKGDSASLADKRWLHLCTVTANITQNHLTVARVVHCHLCGRMASCNQANSLDW